MNAFELAKQKRKALEAEREASKSNAGGNSNFTFEEMNFVGLETEKEVVFRPLGLPFDPETLERHNDYDPKLVLQSQIVQEDKRKYNKLNFPIIVKDGKYLPDPDWIFTRMMSKVEEGKWANYTDTDIGGDVVKKDDGSIVNAKTGKNGYFKKYHKDTDIYNLLQPTGNSRQGDKYPPRVYPSKKIVMNVIGRMDDYSKTNKKTSILSTKVTPYSFKNDAGEDVEINFVDTGISESLYNMIFDFAAKSMGHWDVDFIVTKKPKTQSKYEVWDATFDKMISDESKSIAIIDELTDEEKSYETINLTDKYNPTSYKRLKDIAGHLFKKCDLELNTDFTAELNSLIIEEEKRKSIEKEKSNDENMSKEVEQSKEEIKKEIISDAKKDVVEDIKEDVVEDVVEVEQPKRRPKESVDIRSQCEKYFDCFDKLSKKEQDLLVSKIVSFDGSVPQYSVAAYLCFDEDKCKFKDSDISTTYPEEISVCPICGKS